MSDSRTGVVRVAVVDDQEMVRDGFSMMISAQPDMEVAAAVQDGQQFLDAVRADPHIDVALVDIRMPVLDGLQATRALTAVPHAPAAIASRTYASLSNVVTMTTAGARGFLLKRCSGRELVGAVRTVASGGSILSTEVTGAVLDRVRSAGPVSGVDMAGYRLTGRERDVLALVGAGFNNAEISERLHLSMSTVKSHVTNVLAKTGSRDRVRAAILAIRAGITP